MSQASQQPVDADFPALAAWPHSFSGHTLFGSSPASVTDGLHIRLADRYHRFVFESDLCPGGGRHLSTSQDVQVPFHDLLSG